MMPALIEILRAPLRARTWRETGYLLLGAPLGAAAVGYLLLTLGASVASVLMVGLPLLALAVRGSRAASAMERWRARTLLRTELPAPSPPPPSLGGRLGWLRGALTDRTAWRLLLFLLAGGPLAVAQAYLVAFGWVESLALTTYPLWYRMQPLHDGYPGDPIEFSEGYWHPGEWPHPLIVSGVGLVAAVAVAWLVRGLAAVDRARLCWMLRASATAQVRVLQRRHEQAVTQAGAQLRRIERDLHDGAQVRMVALAMELGRAREELEHGGDSAVAAQRVAYAHEEAKQVLIELRDLARGIYPAVLTDLGLDGAVPMLAARCPMPVSVRVQVDPRPAPPVEAAAYFCAAELLANVTKHSRATSAMLRITRDERMLRLTVVDDGRGGAAARPGGGLAGLLDRVQSLGGDLRLDSSLGGPTTIHVELPCES